MVLMEWIGKGYECLCVSESEAEEAETVGQDISQGMKPYQMNHWFRTSRTDV